MNRVHLLFLFGVLAAASTTACSSSSASNAGGDAGGSSDAGACATIDSACGQPCDKGNEAGVGAYCKTLNDCLSTPQAHLCSSLGDPTTHFCTYRCMAADAEVPEGGTGLPTDCGQGAACTCNSGGECGCTPTVCLGGM